MSTDAWYERIAQYVEQNPGCSATPSVIKRALNYTGQNATFWHYMDLAKIRGLIREERGRYYPVLEVEIN